MEKNILKNNMNYGELYDEYHKDRLKGFNGSFSRWLKEKNITK